MTKKILVPIDIENPQKKVNDLLFPEPQSNSFKLKGIKKGKYWTHGMVILTREFGTNELFKSIVDGGHKIPSVDKLLQTLEHYVSLIPEFRIGNILEIDLESSQLEFRITHKSLTSKKK